MAVAPYICELLSHNLNKKGAPQHSMHNFLLFACISQLERLISLLHSSGCFCYLSIFIFLEVEAMRRTGK